MTSPNQETTRAATDVGEFVSELDGGQFERQLSVALSQVAAKVVDYDKKGKVSIELDFEKITGTFQVRVGHKIKFSHPTGTGKASEETGGATVLHVGKYGALSIAQQALPLGAGKQSQFPIDN